MRVLIYSILIITLFQITACEKADKTIQITAEDYHAAVDQLTAVIVHDIFSPPVVSRIYAYPNIAAYEVLNQNNKEYKSITNQLNDLPPLPKVKKKLKNVNLRIAALVAYLDIGKDLIFSQEKIEVYRDSLYTTWKSINDNEFMKSKEYGLEIAGHIRDWMNKDNYKETRTMPKFNVTNDDPSRWRPTPPTYMDGIEPHWMKIRPFAIDSASQFKPLPPPKFSLEKESAFYKELKEVYDISKIIENKGDESEEMAIAQFWDCNPYVSINKGHFMFASKKITPGAHWIGICKIACKKTTTSFEKAVYAYTKTSIAIADAFISCWDEKYCSNLIRPETLINLHIDENWEPILQTPPFPEYTSGHSVVSGAASVALTTIFGENFSFHDDTEIPYGLPIRNFSSFEQAANEAAISRMYGGIHYRTAVDIGLQQGKNIGFFINDKLNYKY